MAGEIQLNSTTMATESSGSITAQLDTIRPNTTNGSLTLQGDSSDAGVTGLTIDSSGNATFAGTGNNVGTVTAGTLGSSVDIKGAINASGSAPIYACRAWVHFDGTGTPSIAASGNISSITDLGTGLYTCNFATALEDQHYVIACGSSESGAGPTVSDRMTLVARGDAAFSSSSASVHCRDILATTDRDQGNVCVAVFR